MLLPAFSAKRFIRIFTPSLVIVFALHYFVTMSDPAACNLLGSSYETPQVRELIRADIEVGRDEDPRVGYVRCDLTIGYLKRGWPWYQLVKTQGIRSLHSGLTSEGVLWQVFYPGRFAVNVGEVIGLSAVMAWFLEWRWRVAYAKGRDESGFTRGSRP
jgi:hypothetical protein